MIEHTWITPAFPSSTTAESGMALRDWFAGQALSSELLLRAVSGEEDSGMDELWPDRLARLSFDIADAMMREREKKR